MDVVLFRKNEQLTENQHRGTKSAKIRYSVC